MINLEINGQAVQVENGKTVMDAAHQLGIYIPHFCYHGKLSIAANCRMCLVQVEKAPKPLPACATPVTEGMKVYTHSDAAVKAQKGVMEFLLINHPLDCPICDQGGECQLQDLAVGYGASGSRYGEEKRVVVNKNLGPLISTDMTRCIHCTRCVRFGKEIAGVMELGMIGRGEHAEIIQFVGHTVDSELSGNMIDICPVGALTSKPFRYSARTWELTRKPSISPHCGLGSNLTVQIKNNRVMRVLPRENEALNECWLSDRERFAYEGLNAEERLRRPLVKENGTWRECDWGHALERAIQGIKSVLAEHGPASLGALTTAHQTLEEMYLLQKLVRALGAHNIDHRLRQSDFSADAHVAGAPWLGMQVADLEALDSVLVIGSNVRKDHPLIAQRLRRAAKRGLDIHVLHSVDHDLALRVRNRIIAAPGRIAPALAAILIAVAQAKGTSAPELDMASANAPISETARAIARSLVEREKSALLLGNAAQHHPAYALLHWLAQEIARLAGATIGFLGEAANSVGGYIAGAVPYGAGQTGLNAGAMLRGACKAYVLLGVEPELDSHDPSAAMSAMRQARFVLALSAYRHRALDYAHVILPIAPFTETAGTFVNTEGAAQSFKAVVAPLAEARPAWKVLRLIGSLSSLPGFEHESIEAVRAEIAPDLPSYVAARLNNQLSARPALSLPMTGSPVERVGEVPAYFADAIVRRASALQQTKDAAAPCALMNARTRTALGLNGAATVRVRQNGAHTELSLAVDERVADDCVAVAAGHASTASLGAQYGALNVEPV